MPPFPQTEPEIRAAVLEWYSKESNFDKRPIKYMTMTAITPTPAYRYILETFVENRVIGTKSIPFRDQVVPPAKPCPDKWSVKVTPPPTPPGTEVVIDFRETSALQRCPTCDATGKITCDFCAGHAVQRCLFCFGMGYRHGYPCMMCAGMGVVNCRRCEGNGWLACSQCEGGTQVITWNTLTVTWANDVKTFNTSRGDGDLSHELLDKCAWSDVAASQLSYPQDPRPLVFPAEPEVTSVAAKYVKEMMAQNDCRAISFKQSVTTIPVVRVDYTWKNVVDRFYVYGVGRRVHFPNKYPGSDCGPLCCCGNAPCVIVQEEGV